MCDHKDAEGVPVRVCVDAKRFLGIVRAVKAKLPAESNNSCVHVVEFLDVPHGQIQVELLRYPAERPGGSWQLVDALKRQAWGSVRVQQIQPVITCWVVLVGARRLVALPVDEPKELTPELRGDARIGAIADHLAEVGDGCALHGAHGIGSALFIVDGPRGSRGHGWRIGCAEPFPASGLRLPFAPWTRW